MSILILLTLLTVNLPLTLSQREEESVYTETPPTIDGIVSPDEWDDAIKIALRPKMWEAGEPPIGYLMIQNDQEYLYILLDIIQDTELNLEKTAGYAFLDMFYLVFDVDQDGEPTDGVDVFLVPNITREGKTQVKSRCQKFLWATSNPVETVSYYAVEFGETFNEETSHVIWEIAVSLEEISPPGNGVFPTTLNLGVMIFSPNPYIQLSFPQWMPSPGNFDFTKLIIIIIAPPPPFFQVSNLIISPDSVTVGEEVTIEVTVSNTGGSSGSYTVSLKVNGELKESKEITLNAGESTTVTFKFTAEQEGTINVEVNGLTGSFTANPPPTSLIPMEMILAAVGGIAAIAVVLFLKMRKPKEKTLEPTAIRLTADPTEILGDGKSTSTLKIELIDDEGKLIPAPKDIEVKLTSTLGKVTDRIVIPKGSTTGIATLTSSTEFGKVKVIADARGLKSDSTELTFIEKKRYCMHCGARMPLDAEVCLKCGRMPPSGVDVKVCKNCGAIIPVVAKFCSDCGASQA